MRGRVQLSRYALISVFVDILEIHALLCVTQSWIKLSTRSSLTNVKNFLPFNLGPRRCIGGKLLLASPFSTLLPKIDYSSFTR